MVPVIFHVPGGTYVTRYRINWLEQTVNAVYLIDDQGLCGGCEYAGTDGYCSAISFDPSRRADVNPDVIPKTWVCNGNTSTGERISVRRVLIPSE
jgi:hypothetical protein